MTILSKQGVIRLRETTVELKVEFQIRLENNDVYVLLKEPYTFKHNAIGMHGTYSRRLFRVNIEQESLEFWDCHRDYVKQAIQLEQYSDDNKADLFQTMFLKLMPQLVWFPMPNQATVAATNSSAIAVILSSLDELGQQLQHK